MGGGASKPTSSSLAESQSSSSPNTATRKSCKLRLVCINDVYDIDLLPHFATARKAANDADLTLGLLPGDACCPCLIVWNNNITYYAGDFVAPSLLSSLDKGVGMIECLSLSGVDYVCIGK